ncbi:serine hydrolase domain-containing protein [Myceligenerans pegani]|uniref:Beta-lactamase family protein n=1 Tax=Myceligenerans pegani TaxID=2776917 RepID=A0ABR9MSL5_9MICO|nr:serine hydrolase domain-containing protein [Myceligenerans sp. TRM 65318]MBE1874369.1 beta-lactamase family protein [Myceligenerans sp. TRM 65318]MBE3016640.1 beta-lactamase family protein [Myceligenerans sp. TRM 65318]
MFRSGKTYRSRRSARVLAGALLALAVPVAGVAAAAPASSAAGPGEVDAQERLVAEISEAVAEAKRIQDARTDGPQARSAEPGGPASDDVDETLDDAVAAVVADGALGATARVEAPGVRWAGAAGLRELGGDNRATTHDRFRVASNTKTMVATLAMQEVERGTWTLDTTVEDVLPGVLPTEVGSVVTVEQLMSHRSGAPSLHIQQMILDRVADPESWEDFADAFEQRYTIDDHLTTIDATPWEFEPGTGGNYSNAGYVLLGLMLEEETGWPLDTLLKWRVFLPAGMWHADYPTEPGVRGPFMVGAAYFGEGAWESLDEWDPTMFAGAGAATATTRDLNRLNEALFSGRLVSPETAEDMLTPRGPLFGGAIEYGLGVYRVPDPCNDGEYLYGHDGGALGTVSINWSSPDGERQITLGVNARDYSGSETPLYDLDELLTPMLLATC